MAKELTANFSANATKFSSGVQKIKQELTNLNKSLDENKKQISETNKQIKEMEKEQAALEKAEKEAGTATKEEKQRIDELKTAIGQAKVRVAELKTEQAELKGDISNATKALKEQKSGVASVSTEMSKLKTLVTGFIAAYGGRKLFDMLIGSNMEMEQYTTSLEVMLGSAEKATSMVEKMRQFAAQTPLSMNNVISGGTLLLNYGVDESDLIDTMTKLGDLASGNVDKMNRITLAYGQMLAKGKVTGEELMQMTEAGVPLQTALAESIGVTGEEFSKMVSAGKVGIDDLNKAITELTTGDGKFAGMMQKQSETMQGMLSTLQDNVSEFFRKMGEGAFGEVKTALQEVSDQLNEWEQDGTLDEWAQNLGVLLKNLVAFMKQAISVGFQFKEVILAGAVALGTFKVAIGIGNVISATVASIKSFSTATQAATTAQAAFNAVGAANPYVFIGTIIATAIAGVATFIATTNNATQSVEELTQSASELSNEAKTATDSAKKLEEVMKKYGEVANSTKSAAEKTQTLKDLQEQLNGVYASTSDAIDLVNGKYDENIEKLKAATEAERKLAAIKAQAAVNENNKAQAALAPETDAAFTIGINDVASGKIDNPNITAFGWAYNGDKIHGSPSIKIGGTTFAEKAEAYQDYLNYLESVGEENSEAFTAAAKKLEEYTKLAKQAAEDEALLAAATEETAEAVNDNAEKTKTASDVYKEFSTNTEEVEKVTQSLSKEVKTLSSALKEQATDGKISAETALDLIDAGYSQILQIDAETNAIKINAQAYRDLMQAKIDARKAEIQTTISKTREELISTLGGGWSGISAFGMISSGASAADENVQKIYNGLSALEAELGVLNNLGSTVDNTLISYNDGTITDTTKKNNQYTEAYNAYKTEADKKIALIKRELEAKKELRDETIKAIDDEIAARKRLNEDNDMEKQINEVKAQLKYGQLDEFSREQMEKKLQGLYDQKAETQWQRDAQARKDAANAKYDTEQKNYNNQINSINESLKTVQQIMSAMADGSKSVESIVNNNNTRNNTANVNLIGSALTMAQITKAVKDALMDDIVIR